MGKKGQVTLFVIVGILIVVAGALIFSISPKTEKQPLYVEEIVSFISDCLTEKATSSVYEMSRRGGYFLTPKMSTSIGIPIYYNGLNNLVPEKEFVEKEIGEYLSQEMFFCVRNFVDFTDRYEIEVREITADVFISDEHIDFDLHFPVQIKNGDAVSNLRDFNFRLSSKLGIIYDSIVEFVEVSEGKNCLSCILEISAREDIYVDMFDNENNETIFIFRDKDYTFDDKEVLRYVFAEK